MTADGGYGMGYGGYGGWGGYGMGGWGRGYGMGYGGCKSKPKTHPSLLFLTHHALVLS